MDEDAVKNVQVAVVAMFFLLLAGLGLAGSIFTVTDYAKARASRHWPVVDGVILEGALPDCKPLRYVYSVDGRMIESQRTRFFTSRGEIDQASIECRPGGEVALYVSPRDPKAAVLVIGASTSVFLGSLFICAISAFVGVGGLVRISEILMFERRGLSAQNDIRNHQHGVEFQRPPLPPR